MERAKIALNQPIVPNNNEIIQPSWVERQIDYKGINPLICPHCNKELIYMGLFFGN